MKAAKQSIDSELSANEAFIGAIDVGSNAMRLGIATRAPDGTPHLIQRFREPVRLGHDAFTTGILSRQTMDNAIEAFQRFRGILDRHHIDKYRAIATSAMRDSENGYILIRRILEETDIELELISGDEEAQLVHYSICRRADLTDKLTLLVEMGGGSVEVTLCDDGKIVAAQSFKIGTVRLLEILGEGDNFNLLLREYLDGTRKKLMEMIGKRKINLCIATGGNASAIGELAYKTLQTKSPHQISRKLLRQLIKQLAKLNLEERIRKLGLRPDRADVILPAAMVFHDVMSLARVKKMAMPDASLLDGIALDMMDSTQQTFASKRLNLLAW
ncbi:MAG: Ppx/GppA family phosphatase, partial [Mariprofundaceae bacterium]